MKNHLCLLAGVALLTGCATRNVSDDRHGYVSKIYAVGEKPAALPECLATLTPAQLAAGRLVDVKYGTMRLRKHAVAYAPADLPLAPHDKVAFSPVACVGADFPRIQRVVTG